MKRILIWVRLWKARRQVGQAQAGYDWATQELASSNMTPLEIELKVDNPFDYGPDYFRMGALRAVSDYNQRTPRDLKKVAA